MNGLIAAYRLTSEAGKKIAKVKGMPSAWSNPTFLPNFLAEIGPFLLYDKLYLDDRSYRALVDELPTPNRSRLMSIVENESLNLFTLIDAEQVIVEAEGHVFQVSHGYQQLFTDSAFSKAVNDITSRIGWYARPSPLRFEAMNIPVVELLASKWSESTQEHIAPVDAPYRIPLYAVSWEKQIQHVFGPSLASKIVELAPKVIPLVPTEPEIDADGLRRLREDNAVEAYRSRVWGAARRAAQLYRSEIEELAEQLPPPYEEVEHDAHIQDVGRVIERVSASVSEELYDDLVDSWNDLQDRLAIDAWTVFGGLLAVASPVVEYALPFAPPEVTLALGVGSGALVLGQQTINVFRRRRLKWIQFLELVGREAARGSL